MTDVATEGGTIDPAILEDLRRGARCGAAFERRKISIQPWEAYSLIKAKRDLIMVEVDRLSALDDGAEAKLNDDVSSELDLVRKEVGPLGEKLRTYLEGLPAKLDSTIRDLVEVFILTRDEGREDLVCWLADPEGMAGEASTKIGDLASTAVGYQKAMGDTPSAAPASGRSATGGSENRRDKLKSALAALKAKNRGPAPMAMPSDRVEVPFSPPKAESEPVTPSTRRASSRCKERSDVHAQSW